MTWKRKELAQRGKVAAMGMCPSCGADLIPALINRGRDCVFHCSRVRCKYEKLAVPRSSDLYGGPK